MGLYKSWWWGNRKGVTWVSLVVEACFLVIFMQFLDVEVE